MQHIRFAGSPQLPAVVLHTELPGSANDGGIVARPIPGDGREQSGELRRQDVRIQQVAHHHARSGGAGARGDGGDMAAFDGDDAGVAGVGRAGGDLQAGGGADRGQCLAAKAQRCDVLEILERHDLAGRVPRQRNPDLVRLDADAVIAHPDQTASAAFEFHLDAARSGIQRVLDQLLDHRCRALDHLAGGDLTDECVGQDLNGHRRTSRIAHSRTAHPGGPARALRVPRSGARVTRGGGQHRLCDGRSGGRRHLRNAGAGRRIRIEIGP